MALVTIWTNSFRLREFVSDFIVTFMRRSSNPAREVLAACEDSPGIFGEPHREERGQPSLSQSRKALYSF